jgi:hypothetical protein
VTFNKQQIVLLDGPFVTHLFPPPFNFSPPILQVFPVGNTGPFHSASLSSFPTMPSPLTKGRISRWCPVGFFPVFFVIFSNLITFDFCADMLEGQLAELTHGLGWHVLHNEKYPRFDPTTTVAEWKIYNI